MYVHKHYFLLNMCYVIGLFGFHLLFSTLEFDGKLHKKQFFPV